MSTRAIALIEERTTAMWLAENPILENGVFAIETPTANNYTSAKLKKGDGIRTYSQLPYLGGTSPDRTPRITYQSGPPDENGLDSSNSFGGDTHFDGETGIIYTFWDILSEWVELPTWPRISFSTSFSPNPREKDININPSTGAIHQRFNGNWVLRLTVQLAST